MSWVGGGYGDYIQETTYRYVGAGAGQFEVIAQKPKGGLWVYIGGSVAVVLVLIVVIVLLCQPPEISTTTPTVTVLNCDGEPSSWSVVKVKACCAQQQKGCPKPPAPPGTCTLWGDPHIIAFDNSGEDKSRAASFYGDGDFWVVRSDSISIQGRFEGTVYTEGLAATNRIAVGGSCMGGHKIEVGTRESGIVTVDGAAVAFGSTKSDPHFTVTYDANGDVPDVIPEGNEKRVVHMSLPQGIKVEVFQWSNYIDVTITMSVQAGQDGVCGNFNGNLADDTTQSIMQRVGARVKPGESLLSGQAKIDFTPQMAKMMRAECGAAKIAQNKATCVAALGALASTPNLVPACVFDECFGMNVRARSHAKTYA